MLCAIFFQAEDGIRDVAVTGVQTCALPICHNMPDSPKSPRDPPPTRTPPRWNFPIWYLPVALVLLWVWQSMVVQFAYKTIPYSEFKEHLRKGEVKQCAVKENSIEGTLSTATAESSAAAKASSGHTNTVVAPKKTTPKETLFRTIRVEDPDLVGELEK